LQLDVARVDARDYVARVCAIAFVDAQLDETAAHFRGDLNLGRFDEARHAQRTVLCGIVAGTGGAEQEGQNDDESWRSHESFRSMPLAAAFMWRTKSSTVRGAARSPGIEARVSRRCRAK